MRPKISIILPVYNVEKYIAKSIQSILKQTYTNFELLVIIDGSPDNSKEIAEYFLDERIVIYEKQNGGLSDARNYGLERAKGEYIYFMDSDDWIEPNLIEDNLNIIEDGKLDFIVFGYVQDDEDKDGNLLNRIENLPRDCEFKKGKEFEIDIHHLGLLGYAWNKVYRREFLKVNGLIFEKGTSLVEDILFNTQVYMCSNTIKYNPSAYYHYINRPVITLIKNYHSDSYKLKVKKSVFIERFLKSWNVKNKDKILGESLLLGLKYSIANLYLYTNKISSKERICYLREMIYDPRTIEVFQNFKISNFKDTILLILIKNKCTRVIDLIKRIT